jgi:hypothetical protein
MTTSEEDSGRGDQRYKRTDHEQMAWLKLFSATINEQLPKIRTDSVVV